MKSLPWMALAMSSLISANVFAQEANPNGEWNWKLRMRPFTQKVSMTLEKTENKWSGVVKTPKGELIPQDIRVDGNKISFTVKRDKVRMEYDGVIDNDQIRGTCNMYMNSDKPIKNDWVASRPKRE